MMQEFGYDTIFGLLIVFLVFVCRPAYLGWVKKDVGSPKLWRGFALIALALLIALTVKLYSDAKKESKVVADANWNRAGSVSRIS